jgi:hypothetical protein
MNNIIDFERERAKRKSGITDIAVIDDMIANAYDPMDPQERQQYWDRCKLIELLGDGKDCSISIGPFEIEQTDDVIYNSDLSMFFDDSNK